MKALLIKYPQNVSAYQRHRLTGGYKFIDTVKTFNDAWDIVNQSEEPFVDDDILTMKSQSGLIVWEVGDDTFDFGDYKYIVVELSELRPIDYTCDAHILAAIEKEEPWNLEEIKEVITGITQQP